MNRKFAGSLAAAAVLVHGDRGLQQLEPTSSNGSGTTAAQGKPLVIVTTALSPMTDTFNPFVSTSTGYTVHAVDLYHQPLFVFNTLNPQQAPVPELGAQVRLVKRRQDAHRSRPAPASSGATASRSAPLTWPSRST